MGIEQHLVGLQWVGAQKTGPAVRQLDMRHLQLRALVAQNSKVPNSLERASRTERHRRDQNAAAQRSRAPSSAARAGDPPSQSPGKRSPGSFSDPAHTRKSCHPGIRAGEAKRHEIGMQLLDCAPLPARLPGFGLQPTRRLLGKAVNLALSFRHREFWLDGVRRQMPGHASAITRTNGAMASIRGTPVSRAISRIESFCRRCIRRMMFDSPMLIPPSPPPLTASGKVHMAQFSVKITRLPGSVLSENQQVSVISAAHAIQTLFRLRRSACIGSPRRPRPNLSPRRPADHHSGRRRTTVGKRRDRGCDHPGLRTRGRCFAGGAPASFRQPERFAQRSCRARV